ncbi:MAG: hypothetical protein OXU62_08410 [Gammaproteobacteria bacterium]|nr:hypothetical protein [Gammaproteobacteria bacterium]
MGFAVAAVDAVTVVDVALLSPSMSMSIQLSPLLLMSIPLSPSPPPATS